MNTLILSKCIKMKIKEKKDMSYAFIDLRKAFSVRHHKLIEILAKKGLPRKTLILIADMYTGNKTTLQQYSLTETK